RAVTAPCPPNRTMSPIFAYADEETVGSLTDKMRTASSKQSEELGHTIHSEQEDQDMGGSKDSKLGHSTMSTGAPAPSDRNSLTIGPNGPILLHDVHFLEQMAHFNREKVPERQPHAKGAGAFGVFETT